jgi:hypothetical protein
VRLKRACAGAAGCGSLSTSPMKLITAHKILIGSAIIFFAFFALWELDRFFKINESWALVRSGLYFVVALGFAVYFANLKRWYK